MVKSILQCKVGLMQGTAFKETNTDLFDIICIFKTQVLNIPDTGCGCHEIQVDKQTKNDNQNLHLVSWDLY